MSALSFLLGRPLASYEDEEERIGALAGIPIFGLDALGSAAYGPEAALTVLIGAGLVGLNYLLPLTAAIVALLAIVYFSYRQTIVAYPSGGGSYTVAKENLGENAGLFAAASLMTDYLLNVAVGISAGVGALVSALPSLQAYTLWLCLAILLLLTVINLRGTRETGFAFMFPTYLFLVCMLGAIVWGVTYTFAAGGHPHALVSPPHPAQSVARGVGLWLLVKAFASGCTALTGVEAVSNGVQAFKEPVVNPARRTLTVIMLSLTVMLTGIAYLCKAYGITATPPGQAGYQSVLSLLLGAVAGRGVFYFVSMAAILAVLALSANTSFAGFPQLCKAVAADGFLPHSFSNRGRRLVYSEGILVLAFLSALILIIFGGVTDKLIPLFAVGAFLAFTFSQAGMVVHWSKQQGKGLARTGKMLINGVGATATAITICIVLAAKFVEGAWIVALLVPGLVYLMWAVKRHYNRVARETAPDTLSLDEIKPPLVVVPIESWTKVAEKAILFAMTLSADLQAVHVDCTGNKDDLCQKWETMVQHPAREAGRAEPKLVLVETPFRSIFKPLLGYLLKLERENPDRTIAVVLPDFVERHWYYYFLHNQRGKVLSALLLLKGERRMVIVNVPWYLD